MDYFGSCVRNRLKSMRINKIPGPGAEAHPIYKIKVDPKCKRKAD